MHVAVSDCDVLELQRLAQIAQAAGAALDHRLAVKVWREALAMQENPMFRYALGECLMAQKKYAEAEVELKIGSEHKPDYGAFYFDLAVCRQELYDYDGAEAYYRKCLACMPMYADCWNNLGNVLRYELKLEEAEHAYEQALRFGFKRAEMNLALLHLLRNNYPRGWELFEKRIEQGEENAYGPARAFLKSIEG